MNDVPMIAPDPGFLWTGEFRDPDVERRYRSASRGSSMTQIRVIGTLGAVFFLAGTLLDLSLLGYGPTYWELLAIRVAVSAMALALVLASSLIRKPRILDGWVFAMILACTVATCVIIWKSPGGANQHNMTVFFLVMVFYLFVPNRTFLVMLNGVVASVAMGGVLWLKTREWNGDLSSLAFFLFLGNIAASWRACWLQRMRRIQYANLLGEQESRFQMLKEVEERRRAEKVARDSETRFRRLVELSPDAIVVHRDNLVLYANPAALRLIGADQEEQILGQSIMDFIHRRYRDATRDRLSLLDSPDITLPAADLKILRLDGNTLDCNVVSSMTTFGEALAIQSVMRDITEQKWLESELTRLATTDPLTGCHNRRHFLQLCRQELHRAQRYQRSLALLELDFDFFKQINDHFGHSVGDLVLKEAVIQCQKVLRSQDILGRLGGEEFGILIPETDLEGACRLAERLRQDLADMKCTTEDLTVTFTVSIGVTTFRPGEGSMEEGLKRVDRALYRAKGAGRNCVECQP